MTKKQQLDQTRQVCVSRLMKRVGSAYQTVSCMGDESELIEVIKCLGDVIQVVDDDLKQVYLRGKVSLEGLACAISEQEARLCKLTLAF